MTRKMFVLLGFVVLVTMTVGLPNAFGSAVLQVSVAPDVQLIPEDESVLGLRLNLPYGLNKSVYGFDLGVVSQVSGDAAALQVSVLANIVDQNANSLQIATVNSVGNSMVGLQIGILYNTANKFAGIGVGGLVNYYSEEGAGILVGGVVNYSPVLKGLQVGAFNISSYASGLQIGAINYTKKLRGIQIGVINCVEEGPLPFMPVINASF